MLRLRTLTPLSKQSRASLEAVSTKIDTREVSFSWDIGYARFTIRSTGVIAVGTPGRVG